MSDVLIEDLIDTRIGVHDRNHFEVKLDYSIDAERKNRYRVESYFFIPRSLGINRQSYPRDEFYSDVQAYIRLKTPTTGLEQLAKEDAPLGVAKKLIAHGRSLERDEKLREQLSSQLRLVGCIVRAQVRDHVADIGARLADLNGDSERRTILVSDLKLATESFLERLAVLTAKWRALRVDVQSSTFPRSLRETFQFVDEFISLTIETKFSELLGIIDDSAAAANQFVGVRASIRELIVSERQYREGADYRITNDDNDMLVYRMSKLKKFVMSVLWLEITKEKEGSRWVEIASGFAAGVAMLFAALATVLQLKFWLINSSGFIIAAVLTYILKDRIKDWLKRFFAKRLTRFLFDYKVKIRDPISETAIGTCREAMSYVKMSDVPRKVLEARHQDSKVLIEADAKPEVVIRYEKAIRLESETAIERLHTDHFDINDIIRFSLARFLARADDPVSTLPLLNEDTDAVEMVPFRKLYHVNVVMLIHSAGTEGAATKRVRVVFDQDAIVRLDEVQ